jgi:DNA repair exonuclease SbcCD nuclease subunit
VLDYVEGTRAVAEQSDTITFDPLRMSIHAVPHVRLGESGVLEPPERRLGYINVLATHAQVNGNPLYRSLRPAPALALADVWKRYDFVALGHHHHFTQPDLIPNTFYSGALSMVSWLDFRPGASFGWNLVELEPDSSPKVERVQTSTRTMHAYGIDDARGLSAAEIRKFLEAQVAAVQPSGTYSEVTIQLIEQLVRRELNLREIEHLFDGVAGLRVELTSARTSWDEVQRRIQDIGSPAERFEALVGSVGADGDFQEAVRELGLHLLTQAEAAVYERDA